MENTKNYCLSCDKWKQKQKQILDNADSTFDAVYEMVDWEANCKLSCKKYGKENT